MLLQKPLSDLQTVLRSQQRRSLYCHGKQQLGPNVTALLCRLPGTPQPAKATCELVGCDVAQRRH